MRDRRSMLFPCAGFENFFHLGEREVAFVFAIVKMRGESHAGLGAAVDEDFPREKFAADFVGMRAFNENSSGELGGILRRIHLPPEAVYTTHESRCHRNSFRAHG